MPPFMANPWNTNSAERALSPRRAEPSISPRQARFQTRSASVGISSCSSGFDTQQLCRRAAENGDALLVAEAGRAQYEVDLGGGPRERIVGADHDLAGTTLGDQVAQRFW